MAGATGLGTAVKLSAAAAMVAAAGGAAYLLVDAQSARDAVPRVAQQIMQGSAPQTEAEPAAAPAPDTAPDPDTAPGAGTGAAPESAPVMPDAPASGADPALPRFDTVRVAPDGGALVAGRAAPGAEVSVLIEGDAVAHSTADARGDFAAMFALAPSAQPRALALVEEDAEGARRVQPETVIVAPGQVRAATGAAEASAPAESAPPAADAAPGRADSPAAEAATPAATPETAAPPPAADARTAPGAEAARPSGDSDTRAAAPGGDPAPEAGADRPAAPGLFAVSEQGVRVLQYAGAGASPQVMDEIVVDAIAYGDAGEVSLTGRGAGAREGQVRISVDEREIAMAPMTPDGNWQAELPDIAPGDYTLRVDQLDAAGQVESRFETPFRRESPEQIARLAPDGHARSGVITVQPGHTLWGISRSHYGRGVLYVQVFEENREQIRDPDLIFPGQVFDIPKIPRAEIEALP